MYACIQKCIHVCKKHVINVCMHKDIAVCRVLIPYKWMYEIMHVCIYLYMYVHILSKEVRRDKIPVHGCVCICMYVNTCENL